MGNTPETIYLIQSEYDGERGLVWCDDPAPDDHWGPDEAVKHVRADVHQEIVDRQAKVALMGMDAAKKHALSAERHAKQMLSESSPEVLDFKREARYYVIKRRDISADQEAVLQDALHGAKIPCQESVVVENDWPNYEHTPIES